MKTKDIFCANEQLITPHTMSVDGNGEVLATCSCGRVLKFVASTPKELNSLIDKHEQSNSGQVSKEAQDKLLNAILGETDKPEEVV